MEKALQVKMMRDMIRIRCFEEKVLYMDRRGEIPGFVHLYTGEEASAVGVCSAINTDDYITSTHRGHGHMIAKGADPKRMFAELLGKEAGYNKGKGGSMHIADSGIGFLGANGIVGAGIPLATGAALSSQYLENGKIAICMFGDGASLEATFYESLNIAALFKLPCVYVCENNLYGEQSKLYPKLVVTEHISDRAKMFGIPCEIVDGNDVEAVREAMLTAVERARTGGGPTLIENMTYRWLPHCQGNKDDFRSDEEKAYWREEKDPIMLYTKKLTEAGIMTEEEIETIWNEARQEIEDAVKFAEEAPFPPLESALEDVFAD